MKIISLTNGTELKSIMAQNKWSLVKFSAVWCKPCQLLASVYDTVVEQRPGLQTVTVNVDLHPTLAHDYNICSVPTLPFFKQGEVASQLVGLQNGLQSNAWINQNIQPVK